MMSAWRGLWHCERRRRFDVPGQAFLRAELTTNTFKSPDPERAIAVLPGTAIEQHDPQPPVMTDAATVEDMIGR
jgi:hypothetical protein